MLPDTIAGENIVHLVDDGSELRRPVVDVVHEAQREVAVDAARSYVGGVHARARHALVELAQLQAELPD